jgi:monooxygenase
MTMTNEHFDVVIIGAGLSGIAAAHHVMHGCPEKRFLIIEARDAIGGTWDLFRYPGIRSDSDMHTLGYGFRPWLGKMAIASGPEILDYMHGTVRDEGLAPHIRLGHRLVSADWSDCNACWQLTIDHAGQTLQMECNFLFTCTGYYRYDRGYLPEFKGAEQFAGLLVHPQFWPEYLDTHGKRIVIIGSGATAVTLVPALAATAQHVTMVQRSPTYVVSQPAADASADRLRQWLPPRLAYGLTRWKNILTSILTFAVARRWPDAVRAHIIAQIRSAVGSRIDVDQHFTPSYQPWDQRVCLVPDGDLFHCLRTGSASIETGTIAAFEATGVRMTNGRLVAADIVVTATGLELELLGGASISVNGVKIDMAQSYAYKGMMYSGVPNLASAYGYTNASWTLKSELIARYVVRLLNHMARTGARKCQPISPENIAEQPLFALSAGYIERAKGRFPRQGRTPPWKTHQNYVRDMLALRWGRVDDGVMRFSGQAAPDSG